MTQHLLKLIKPNSPVSGLLHTNPDDYHPGSLKIQSDDQIYCVFTGSGFTSEDVSILHNECF